MKSRLFITTKDRCPELAILCKSLIHSDFKNYINEVVFLDDHSEDSFNINRIYSAFMYSCLRFGINCRFLQAKDGRAGINQSLDRIKYYKTENIWILNGDMMVFSNYFEKCSKLNEWASNNFKGKSNIISGFNTWLHPAIEKFGIGAIRTANVGGCSILTSWDNLDNLLECFSSPTMNRGWDLHMGAVFDNIFVTNPSVSQHIGMFEGLNIIGLSGFPGAWADIRG